MVMTASPEWKIAKALVSHCQSTSMFTELLIQTFGFLSRQARGSVKVDGDTYAPSLNDDQSSDGIGIGGHLQQFWLGFRWA
jgi:hypothetical protein